jgi:glutathione peroxidase
MKLHTILGLAGILVADVAFAGAPENIYGFEAKNIDGKTVKMDEYKGKVLLVVNVASKCGYTPQYEGLEALYKKHASEGLVLVGFPSNQFKGQEPGTEAEIKQFCSTKYGVTFPMMSKVDVNGEKAHPLYQYLRTKTGAEDVKWNFTKFLVDRKGQVVKRFESKETPEQLEPAIEAELAKR